MINLIQPITPELGSFAKGSLSKRPNLWNGLVGCWKPSFGVTGQNLVDVSGYGNHGTLTNMTTDNWVRGDDARSPGYILDYDGVDNDVQVPHSDIIVPANQGTVVAWFRADSTNSGHLKHTGILQKQRTSNPISSPSYAFNWVQIGEGSEVRRLWWRVGSTIIFTEDASVLGIWRLAVGTYSATANRLFVDGELKATGSSELPITTAGNPLVIGRTPIATDTPFHTGGIGNTMVYDRVLSPSEILDLYLYPNAMFEFAERGIFGAPVAGSNDVAVSFPVLTVLGTDVPPSTATLTLPVLTVLSTAVSLHGDATLTLPVLTVLSTAVSLHGDATLTLPVLTVDALAKNHADADLTLPVLAVLGTDVPPSTATLVLPILTVLGAGNAGGNSGTITLPVLTVLSTAISLHGDTSITLPVLTVLSTSSVSSTGDGNINLPLLLLSATDVAPATSSLTLPVLTVLSTAISLHGDTSITLPVLTVASTSIVPGTGDVSITLPVLVISASSGLGGIVFPLLSLVIRAYNGSAPECVVMNTKNFAVTEYLNYGFNSMAKFNGSDLIADQNAIYEEDGSDTDHAGIDDYPIKAHIKSGRIDLFKGSVNKLRNAWVNYQSDGDIRMVTRSDKKETRYYNLPFLDTTEGINERRVKFQKGIRNRYIDFKTQNISGSQMEIDKITITLEPIVSKRR